MATKLPKHAILVGPIHDIVNINLDDSDGAGESSVKLTLHTAPSPMPPSKRRLNFPEDGAGSTEARTKFCKDTVTIHLDRSGHATVLGDGTALAEGDMTGRDATPPEADANTAVAVGGPVAGSGLKGRASCSGGGSGGGGLRARKKWTPELHASFVSEVDRLGIDTAVPSQIMEHMRVPGLTRQHIASHLQKYRLRVRCHNTVEGGQATEPSAAAAPPSEAGSPVTDWAAEEGAEAEASTGVEAGADLRPLPSASSAAAEVGRNFKAPWRGDAGDGSRAAEPLTHPPFTRHSVDSPRSSLSRNNQGAAAAAVKAISAAGPGPAEASAAAAWPPLPSHTEAAFDAHGPYGGRTAFPAWLNDGAWLSSDVSQWTLPPPLRQQPHSAVLSYSVAAETRACGYGGGGHTLAGLHVWGYAVTDRPEIAATMAASPIQQPRTASSPVGQRDPPAQEGFFGGYATATGYLHTLPPALDPALAHSTSNWGHRAGAEAPIEGPTGSLPEAQRVHLDFPVGLMPPVASLLISEAHARGLSSCMEVDEEGCGGAALFGGIWGAASAGDDWGGTAPSASSASSLIVDAAARGKAGHYPSSELDEAMVTYFIDGNRE